MPDREETRRAASEGIPVAPSLEPALESVEAPLEYTPVSHRAVFVSGIAILIALAAGVIAEALLRLIGLITNLAFYGRISFEFVPPVEGDPSLWVIVIPVIGALIIGLMARYGSPAIRGHGIPEVMERVLHGRSRIAPRLMFLKPLSAAIAIGTGGPFGAEGPIIATGGALGSTVGQALRITADERKTLLAAGAAAGMAATFGSPVSAVLLAVELLLFEYRPRSIIPVALAAAAATGVRMALVGSEPIFSMPALEEPSGAALASYIVIGALIGVASVYVTRAVYAIEDGFERLPIHWMWWPALGAVVVGVVGYIEPDTLGVGYYNIDRILSGEVAGMTLVMLVLLKFVSWSVYLGSGTSGGTLAPLFIIGGGLGAILGGAASAWLPALGVSTPIAGLVGMAAIFAGASHALLASVVFAFETTRQPIGLLPLLAGCSTAYLISLLMMRHSIMTEKLARRGTAVRTEYAVDYFNQVSVESVATREVATLRADDTIESVRDWLVSDGVGTTHNGFPVLDEEGRVEGVVTRRDLLDPDVSPSARVRDVVKRAPAVVYPDNTLRDAADHMVRHQIGRLPVVDRTDPRRMIGIVTRSDLLAAHQQRLDAEHHAVLHFGRLSRRRVRRVARSKRRKPGRDGNTKSE